MTDQRLEVESGPPDHRRRPRSSPIRDGESLVGAVMQAAQDSPAAAAAVGAVAGFATGRVIKAAMSDDASEEDQPARPGDGGS